MATANLTSQKLAPIAGWASSGTSIGDEHETSVVIGPDATASGLLSWSIGQIQQLNVLLDAINAARHIGGVVDSAEICGSVRHQLQQVEAALEGAARLALKHGQAWSASNRSEVKA
jgi:hypothetical protein